MDDWLGYHASIMLLCLKYKVFVDVWLKDKLIDVSYSYWYGADLSYQDDK